MKLKAKQAESGLTISGREIGEVWDEGDPENAARLIGLGVAEPIESGDPSTPTDTLIGSPPLEMDAADAEAGSQKRGRGRPKKAVPRPAIWGDRWRS